MAEVAWHEDRGKGKGKDKGKGKAKDKEKNALHAQTTFIRGMMHGTPLDGEINPGILVEMIPGIAMVDGGVAKWFHSFTTV